MKINMVRVEVVGDVGRLAGPGLRRFLRVGFVALDVASRRWRPLSLFVWRRRGGGVEASRAWRGRPSLHAIAASRSRAFTPPARRRRDRRRRTVRTIGSPGDDAVAPLDGPRHRGRHGLRDGLRAGLYLRIDPGRRPHVAALQAPRAVLHDRRVAQEGAPVSDGRRGDCSV